MKASWTGRCSARRSTTACAALVADLNRLHRHVPALHELDTDARGFAWTQPNEPESGLLSFLRFSSSGDPVLVVCNFTPVVRTNVLAGVPRGGLLDASS